MEKTAMTQLRDKLLTEVQNLKEAAKFNEYLKAYREALINVANDIDAQMLQMEKEQVCAFANDYADQVMAGMMKRAEEYYNETFGELKP